MFTKPVIVLIFFNTCFRFLCYFFNGVSYFASQSIQTCEKVQNLKKYQQHMEKYKHAVWLLQEWSRINRSGTSPNTYPLIISYLLDISRQPIAFPDVLTTSARRLIFPYKWYPNRGCIGYEATRKYFNILAVAPRTPLFLKKICQRQPFIDYELLITFIFQYYEHVSQEIYVLLFTLT